MSLWKSTLKKLGYKTENLSRSLRDMISLYEKVAAQVEEDEQAVQSLTGEDREEMEAAIATRQQALQASDVEIDAKLQKFDPAKHEARVKNLKRGGSAEPQPQPEPPAEPQPQPEPPIPPVPPAEPAQQNPPQKKKSGWLILGATLLAVAGAIVGINMSQNRD